MEWKTLKTITHSATCHGVDASLDYHVQARPEECGSISLRVYVGILNLYKSNIVPARAKKHNTIWPTTQGTFPCYYHMCDCIGLPMNPPTFCSNQTAGNRFAWVAFKKVQYYSGAVGKHGDYTGYSFCEHTESCDGYCKASEMKTVAPDDVARELADLIEFVSECIRWRDGFIAQYNDWCKPFDDADIAAAENLSKAQTTIDDLSKLIDALSDNK